MQNLDLRIKEFLGEPLPGEIALNHNPDSLTELVLSSYASGQQFDAGLVKMAQICVGEVDAAVANVSTPEGRAYLMSCRRLLVEVLQEVM